MRKRGSGKTGHARNSSRLPYLTYAWAPSFEHFTWALDQKICFGWKPPRTFFQFWKIKLPKIASLKCVKFLLHFPARMRTAMQCIPSFLSKFSFFCRRLNIQSVDYTLVGEKIHVISWRSHAGVMGFTYFCDNREKNSEEEKRSRKYLPAPMVFGKKFIISGKQIAQLSNPLSRIWRGKMKNRCLVFRRALDLVRTKWQNWFSFVTASQFLSPLSALELAQKWMRQIKGK